VNKRIVKPYVMIAAGDAKTIGLKEGDSLSFKMDDETFQLPVKVSASMSPGIAGVPYGLWGVPSGELPAWGLIENK
jgi:anaerobic selenocysteine-containing dehydrogenase